MNVKNGYNLRIERSQDREVPSKSPRFIHGIPACIRHPPDKQCRLFNLIKTLTDRF